MAMWSGSWVSVPGLSMISSNEIGVCRVGMEAGPKATLPALSVDFQSLIENRLKPAYKLTTQGKFVEAMAHFTGILLSIPFLIVNNKKEVSEVKDLLEIAVNYITGIRMELHRKTVTDPVRQAELAAFFTHCNLQQVHQILALRSAMTTAYKIQNHQHAGSFANRLLELDAPADVQTQVTFHLLNQIGQESFEIVRDQKHQHPCAQLR